MWRPVAQAVRQLVYPSVCARCRELLSDAQAEFCATCAHDLTEDDHFTCPRCSSPVPQFSTLDDGCPRCRDEPYQFAGVLRLSSYEGPLRESIIAMKTRGGEILAEALGRLWAKHYEQRFRALGIDLVIPVPLHRWRRLQRGFNQSAILSHSIAEHLRLDHRPRWLRKIKWTPSQVELSPTERRQNLAGAFAVSRFAQVRGRTILLVDDVFTTGSTVNEATKALKKAGAAAVWVAVLAHR